MNPILQENLVFVFISLNEFMMSYFGHTHIHLAGKMKYVARNMAKPGGLLHRGRISTSVTANPRFKSQRGSRNYELHRR